MKTTLFIRTLVAVVLPAILVGGIPPLQGQNDPSREILVYCVSGAERTALGQPARITSANVQAVLDRFKISPNEVTSAFPNFNLADTLMHLPDGRVIGNPNLAKIFRVTVSGNVIRDSVIKALSKLPEVLFAEQNGVAVPQVVPNDQYFSYQWSLQAGGGTGRIQAPEAWDIYTGLSSNIIGVIDFGVDGTHPDLSGKVTGDAPSTVYHGTHVAGIAAAKTNNTTGVAGIDWSAQLLSKNIETSDDQGIYQKVVDAVNYSSNVRVLNNSWVLVQSQSNLAPRYSTAVRMAFAYAYKMNRVAVCANGNYQDLYPGQTYYPAGFGQGIIAVGATDASDVIWYRSQVNSAIDVSAPGVSVLSTYRNGDNFSDPNYYYNTGTSMATPHASGIASLLKGYNPNLYNDDIEHIIQLSADDKGPTGWDSQYGYGRVNAKKALDYLRPPYVLTQASATGGTDLGGTGYFQMVLYGAPGLADGAYTVKRHEVQRSITFAARIDPKVWGRGASTNGWSTENPNFAMGWCDVVPGTVTPTSATLRSYVYEVWTILGQWVGWKPTTPSNVAFAYSVLGAPAPLSVSISGPTYLNSGQVGTWTATALGGTPPYHYQWWYYPECGAASALYRPAPLKPPCGDWYTGGSDSPTFQRSDVSSFRVKCVVTDAVSSSATSNVIYVTVGGAAKLAADGTLEGAAAATDVPSLKTPTSYGLDENYPNPFNPSTIISYQLPASGHVSLKVYNMLGQEVATLVDAIQDAGFKSVTFDASRLPSGVYFYRLESGTFIQNKKMLLVK